MKEFYCDMGCGFAFDLFLSDKQRWSEQTFGPGDRTVGVVNHIKQELDEILAKPNDLSEWMDVVILALDGAWRSGATTQDIIDALVAKHLKNKDRKWPDWRQFTNGEAINHDRSHD
jgi:hypothetical protein